MVSKFQEAPKINSFGSNNKKKNYAYSKMERKSAK